MDILMTGCLVQIGVAENGGRSIILVHEKSGIRVVAPLDSEVVTWLIETLSKEPEKPEEPEEPRG